MLRHEDLASLAQFLTVTEEGSFTKAAARLGVSQSALSHAVRRLEARLGIRLLTRTTRSVAPTDAGARLLETLRPALGDISTRLDDLTALRDRPAGNLRLTCSKHAAKTVIWPAVDRLTSEYPDINVELSIDAGLTDIVAQRFDAGVRLGERLEKDMVAVRIGPRIRMAAVATPAYFEKHGRPETPAELAGHDCINLRLESSGGLYVWEFEKDGREVNVKVSGHLVCNDVDIIVDAVLAGHGVAFLAEDHFLGHVAEGRLVRVLEDWCEPFDGLYLYYPSRRQPSPAFSLLLKALRFRD